MSAKSQDVADRRNLNCVTSDGYRGRTPFEFPVLLPAGDEHQIDGADRRALRHDVARRERMIGRPPLPADDPKCGDRLRHAAYVCERRLGNDIQISRVMVVSMQSQGASADDYEGGASGREERRRESEIVALTARAGVGSHPCRF